MQAAETSPNMSRKVDQLTFINVETCNGHTLAHVDAVLQFESYPDLIYSYIL